MINNYVRTLEYCLFTRIYSLEGIFLPANFLLKQWIRFFTMELLYSRITFLDENDNNL